MTNDNIFQLQRAQRIGQKTVTIEARLNAKAQKATFENTTVLDDAKIIGIVCFLPGESIFFRDSYQLLQLYRPSSL